MNLDLNSSSVGTSFLGSCGPWIARNRSRSSPHRFAPDLDCTGDFTRSRYRVPSGSPLSVGGGAFPPLHEEPEIRDPQRQVVFLVVLEDLRAAMRKDRDDPRHL